jgi:hypothetical protein
MKDRYDRCQDLLEPLEGLTKGLILLRALIADMVYHARATSFLFFGVPLLIIYNDPKILVNL